MKEKLLTVLNRVTKSGLNSFWRNKWVSTATISVMVITLSLITSLFLLSVVVGSILDYQGHGGLPGKEHL